MNFLKKFISRLLKPGKMNDEVKAHLQKERIQFLKENFWVSVKYKNFKAPGKRYYRKHEGVLGSIGISSKRIVAFAFSRMIIHVSFEDHLINKITFTATEKYLSASFNAADFNQEHSGNIEMRFRLSEPLQVFNLIERLKRSHQ